MYLAVLYACVYAGVTGLDFPSSCSSSLLSAGITGVYLCIGYSNVFTFLFHLRQGFPVWYRMASNSWPFHWCGLLSLEIIVMIGKPDLSEQVSSGYHKDLEHSM